MSQSAAEDRGGTRSQSKDRHRNFQRLFTWYRFYICLALYLCFGSLSSQHAALYSSFTRDSGPDEGQQQQMHPASEEPDFIPTRAIPANRTAPLNPNRQFSFIHISKCAGGSWIDELLNILGRAYVFPQDTAGNELAVAYQEQEHPDSDYLLIALKSPRHHVLSMFHECKYKKWGVKTREDEPGRAFDPNMNDDQSFDMWLSYFVKETKNGTLPYTYNEEAAQDKFKCYHPSNYQSRFLTSKDWDAQSMDLGAGFEPDTNHALDTLHRDKMAWVGISDFFHESKCLLYYRVLLGVKQENNNRTSNTTKAAWVEGIGQGRTKRFKLSIKKPLDKDAGDPRLDKMEKRIQYYIDRTCLCPALESGHDRVADANNRTTIMNESNNNSTTSTTTVDSYGDARVHPKEEQRRRTMIDLPQRTLDMVAALTRSDTVIYKHALSEFLAEIVWLEQRALQRRVLCDHVLQAAQPKLAYLGVNITEIYYHHLRRAMEVSVVDE